MAMNLYNLIDLETNNIHSNLKSSEVAKLIGKYSSYIPYVARNNIIVDDKYWIEMVGKIPPKSEPRFPQELLEEWDKVTKAFRTRGFINEKVF